MFRVPKGESQFTATTIAAVVVSKPLMPLRQYKYVVQSNTSVLTKNTPIFKILIGFDWYLHESQLNGFTFAEGKRQLRRHCSSKIKDSDENKKASIKKP